MEVWAAALHQQAPGHAPPGAQQFPEDVFLGFGTFELQDLLTKAQARLLPTPSIRLLLPFLTAPHSCRTWHEFVSCNS